MCAQKLTTISFVACFAANYEEKPTYFMNFNSRVPLQNVGGHFKCKSRSLRCCDDSSLPKNDFDQLSLKLQSAKRNLVRERAPWCEGDLKQMNPFISQHFQSLKI